MIDENNLSFAFRSSSQWFQLKKPTSTVMFAGQRPFLEFCVTQMTRCNVEIGHPTCHSAFVRIDFLPRCTRRSFDTIRITLRICIDSRRCILNNRMFFELKHQIFLDLRYSHSANCCYCCYCYWIWSMCEQIVAFVSYVREELRFVAKIVEKKRINR